MYKRLSDLQECWEQDNWYGLKKEERKKDEISVSLTYNSSEEDLETLAALKPDWFVYDKPFLLSPDRTVMYGFCVTDSRVLAIPDSVIVYDNLLLHEEETGYRKVIIGAELEQIIQLDNCFGYFVEEYAVNPANPNFVAENGMLFDELPEDHSSAKLILFPPAKGTKSSDEYIQFPPRAYITIGKYAFCMKGFVRALSLPPYAEIEENAFRILEGQGIIFATGDAYRALEKAKRGGRLDGVRLVDYLEV